MCMKHEIFHYHLTENGVFKAEAFIKHETTSLNIAMAMFLQASVHLKKGVDLWPIAIMYAAYNKNYTPRT